MDLIDPKHLIEAATPLIDHVIDRAKAELLPAVWQSLFDAAIATKKKFRITIAGIPIDIEEKPPTPGQ